MVVFRPEILNRPDESFFPINSRYKLYLTSMSFLSELNGFMAKSIDPSFPSNTLMLRPQTGHRKKQHSSDVKGLFHAVGHGYLLRLSGG